MKQRQITHCNEPTKNGFILFHWKVLYVLVLLLLNFVNAFSQFNVIGYLPTWGGDLNAVQYSKLTHINYAFLIPNSDGSYQAIDGGAARLNSLVSMAHTNNVKVLISVGGGGGGNAFKTIVPSAALRTAFVNNMVSFCNQYNVDGVDIDWEFPSDGTEANNFSLLMQQLSTAMHANGRLCAAAVIAYGGTSIVNGVFSSVDFLNIMAYDENNFQHSTYDVAVKSVNYWVGRGLPASKAIIGVPFYGRDNRYDYKTVGYNDILAQGGSPNADSFQTVGYNGIPTIKKKTAYAMQACGGIMIWSIDTDATGANSLLSAINEVVVANAITYPIPGTVQAENYSAMSGVQLETTTDTGGGQNVGYIDTGDWMDYKVNVQTAGTYTVSYRVASLNGGGSIQLKSGSTVLATTAVNSTGGWQTWTTVTATATLAAGSQTLRLQAAVGGFNINWISMTGSSSFSTTIQAESYTQMFGVQTETTTDTGGGQNVGYIDTNDWMLYSAVNIPSAGTYTVQYRVASLNGGGSIQIEKAGGSAVFGSIAVPSTGGWQTWTTISQNVTLPAGSLSFGIKALVGGFNLNWFSVKTPNSGARDAVTEMPIEANENIISAHPNPSTGRVTIAVNLQTAGHVNISMASMLGGQVAQVHDGYLDAGNHEFDFNGENLPSGLYIYSIVHNGSRTTKKLLIGH